MTECCLNALAFLFLFQMTPRRPFGPFYQVSQKKRNPTPTEHWYLRNISVTSFSWGWRYLKWPLEMIIFCANMITFRGVFGDTFEISKKDNSEWFWRYFGYVWESNLERFWRGLFKKINRRCFGDVLEMSKRAICRGFGEASTER